MDHEMKKVLVTGSAGFIGFHLSRKLLDNNIEVVGLDNLNPYYDPDLKKARLEQLTVNDSYTHVNLTGATQCRIFMKWQAICG